MKNFKSFMILFVVLIVCTVMVFAKKGLESLTQKQITAESLWTRITKEDDYKKYSFWPDHKGMQPGRAPHGPFHKIFINDVILSSIPMTNKIVPEGGMIVKEGYDADQELSRISVMVKVKDYDSNDNNWFWAQYYPDGKVESSGKTPVCIACHKAFSKNDYIVIHKLEK